MAVKSTIDDKQIRMAEELLFSGKQLPSFAKALYFGIFDGDRVFPFPEVNAEERLRTDAFVEKLRAWADKELDPDRIDRDADIPDSVVRGLAQLGVLGCTISKEYGGLEFTQYAYCRMVEEIARRCGATTLFINAHQSIGMKALLLYGTKEQKERWLPPLARGEILAAFALTEPNAGSDAAGVETRAVYDPRRKAYVINGQKQWITNGGIADILTVMAQTTVETPNGPEDRITAFLVTPDMPGFKVVDAALEKVGMRGSKTARLAFENLVVPEENILGPLGGGLKVALTVLNFGRTTFGAGCTGNCKEMYERALERAKTRHQFGQPLAAFGLVKEKIATMAALTYAVEATTYLTAGLLDRGQEDFAIETAIVKVFSSECQWRICYEAMQIFGGKSLFTDEPFERFMRDARLNTIGEGANEVLRAFLIAAAGMRDVGMQMKDVLDSLLRAPLAGIGKALGFGKSNLGRLVKTPVVPVRSAVLREEADKLAHAVKRFGRSLARLLATYRERIVEKQLACNRIADAAIALYTTTAVLSKLDSDLTRANGHAERLANDTAVAKLYCHMAFQRIDQALGGLYKNLDDEIEAVSDRLTGRT